jgi:hypothetical protein
LESERVLLTNKNGSKNWPEWNLSAHVVGSSNNSPPKRDKVVLDFSHHHFDYNCPATTTNDYNCPNNDDDYNCPATNNNDNNCPNNDDDYNCPATNNNDNYSSTRPDSDSISNSSRNIS